MWDQPGGSIIEHFKYLPDPRVECLCDYKLLDILTIAICGMICGADDWVAVATFGEAREWWFRRFLDLPEEGTPSHDTFTRVFAMLDPQQFRRCFLSWVRAVHDVTQGQVVPIDGKTVRRSRDGVLGVKAIHMVSAWATENALVLGQIKVDEKSNEITAIPKLLQMLALSGCIVTIDAMGCQKKIAQAILDQDADYVLRVKENQGKLYYRFRQLFHEAERTDYAGLSHDISQRTVKGHGRIDIRRCSIIDDPEYLFYVRGPEAQSKWPGLRSIVRIEAERRIGGETSREIRYYIASFSCAAKEMNRIIRSHWRIENSLHWVLDIAFREDQSRVRRGNGAEILAMLRHLVLNLLQQEQSAQIGIRNKRLLAAWNPRYLLKVLTI